ncbi:hypothetical protein [Microbacterium terrisoli]|uniref:hypothetical protein n=1 Tax=Microbacterium terrisoli TaxID=3242192 RepID=UPI002804F05F|nr:hypothetical protein [Microbacterium protaetiae]
MARPKALAEDDVRMETCVPAGVGTALDIVVALTGASRATVLRQVIVAGLESYALVNPEIAAALPTTTYKKEQDRS